MCNIVQNKFLIILLSFDIVQKDVSSKIGNPVEFGHDDAAAAAARAQPVSAAPMHTHAGSMYGVHPNTNPATYGNPAPVVTPPAPMTRMPSAQAHPTPYPGMHSSMITPNTVPSAQVSSYPTSSLAHPPPTQNMYHRPAPVPSSSSAMPSIVRSNTTLQHFTPIANLNQYQNRWTIKARVTSKSEVRNWSNAKGQGNLFSMELVDSSGVDIKATFFKEAVDRFYPMIQVDKVYTLSGGKLKTANLQYNKCKSGFEITFDQNAEIALAEDDIHTQVMYSCVPIAALETKAAGDTVDVVAVVKQVSPPSTILSKKSGQEMFKADLVLVDDSNCEVTCTLWGERAQRAEMEFSGQPVVAFRRLRISEYGGRSLSASTSSVITVQPQNLMEAERIKSWWYRGGANQGGSKNLSAASGGSGGGAGRFPSLEERKSVSAIRGENMGLNPEKADWISFKATFTFIKSDKEGGPWYTACPNAGEPCKNRYKVTASPDGGYHCDHCNQTYPTCMRKFIFSATVSDDSCTVWVSMFDDQARLLLDGATADALHSELELGNQSSFESYFTRANYTDWIMTCKVKQEMGNDEMRLKTSIMSLHPMDYAKEGRALLNAILK
jgi:replication factor A1